MLQSTRSQEEMKRILFNSRSQKRAYFWRAVLIYFCFLCTQNLEGKWFDVLCSSALMCFINEKYFSLTYSLTNGKKELLGEPQRAANMSSEASIAARSLESSWGLKQHQVQINPSWKPLLLWCWQESSKHMVIGHCRAPKEICYVCFCLALFHNMAFLLHKTEG